MTTTCMRGLLLAGFLTSSTAAVASYSNPGALFGFDAYLCLESNANFRTAPNRYAEVVKVLAKDGRHYSDAMTGDGSWFRFSIDDKTGFLHRSVLRIENCEP
jgi:hypothetical protein